MGKTEINKQTRERERERSLNRFMKLSTGIYIGSTATCVPRCLVNREQISMAALLILSLGNTPGFNRKLCSLIKIPEGLSYQSCHRTEVGDLCPKLQSGDMVCPRECKVGKPSLELIVQSPGSSSAKKGCASGNPG